MSLSTKNVNEEWQNDPRYSGNMADVYDTKVGYGWADCGNGEIYWTGIYGEPRRRTIDPSPDAPTPSPSPSPSPNPSPSPSPGAAASAPPPRTSTPMAEAAPGALDGMSGGNCTGFVRKAVKLTNDYRTSMELWGVLRCYDDASAIAMHWSLSSAPSAPRL
jgi:hypothetical protein